MSPEEIRKISVKWHNMILVTTPSPALKDPEQLMEKMANRYLDQTPSNLLKWFDIILKQ